MKYFSVKECAAFLGISEQAVRKQIKAGKLKTIETEKDGKKRILIEQPEPEAAAAPEPDQGQPTALIAAIDALTEQLKAKDLQIAKLQQLLENAQLQQAHTSKLLEGKISAYDVQPEAAAAPDREASAPDQSAASSPAEPKAEKKRGFWSVFFD